MRFVDEEAKRYLASVRSARLEELIEETDKLDKEDRSDLEILYDEVNYLVELYMEDGTAPREEYLKAKEIVRKTENGKVMPLNPISLKPRYSKQQVEDAKELVNEVRRLKRLSDTLCIKIYCDCEDDDEAEI